MVALADGVGLIESEGILGALPLKEICPMGSVRQGGSRAPSCLAEKMAAGSLRAKARPRTEAQGRIFLEICSDEVRIAPQNREGVAMPKFMITVRSVSGGQFGGDLGAVRYLVVPDGADTPLPEHAMSQSRWIAQVIASFPNTASVLAPHPLVGVIHGFNVNAKGAADLHAAIASGLAGANFSPTIVSFDWPSHGEVYAYIPDVDVAKRTAIDFVNCAVKPLKAQTPNCKVVVNALCHSMGAFVLREALDHADDGLHTDSDWMLGQLVMVAGDVDATDFVAGNKDTESMLGHAYRLTNYFNRYDEVLAISRAKNGGVDERAGRVGLPPNAPSKTVNLDCSQRYNAIPNPGGLNPIAHAEFSHGWYFQDANFYADLAETLRGAIDRTVVAGRTQGDGATLNLPA